MRLFSSSTLAYKTRLEAILIECQPTTQGISQLIGFHAHTHILHPQ